jgi:hypothetical protein
MTGKPLYLLLLKTTSDRSDLSQTTLLSIIISLRIPVLSKGAMMIINCPCSKKVTGWMKLFAIRLPAALLDPPFNQGE